ncbi:MAG: hypothetical protein AAGM38_01860 [Pseudomonadota bacterium]
MTGLDVSLETAIALGSAAIALVSLFLNHSVVRRQLALHREEIRAAVDQEKARWLGETLSAFAEAEALALSEACDDLEPRRLLVAQRLSALADQGRLSFPNLDPQSRGAENPAAYQGSRQPALDAVIMAHDLMRELPELRERAHAPAAMGREVQRLLFKCRRVLVSEVQKSVDPRRRAEVLEAQKRRGKDERAISHKEVREILAKMEALEMEKISFE